MLAFSTPSLNRCEMLIADVVLLLNKEEDVWLSDKILSAFFDQSIHGLVWTASLSPSYLQRMEPGMYRLSL